MNQITPKKPHLVGHWVLLGFLITSLVLSQVARIIFIEHVTFNPNLAFGITIPNQDRIIIPLVILFLLLVFVWYLKKTHKNTYEIAAFGMILGGGTSNLVERFIYSGQVADYWNLFNMSTINLADIFIGLGIIIMFIILLRNEK